MKPTASDVLNTAAIALGGVALWNIDAITAAAGPKVGLYALIAKGAAGWLVDTYNRVKAARLAAMPVPPPETKP